VNGIQEASAPSVIDTPITECEDRVADLKELVVHLSGVGSEAQSAAMIVHEVTQPLAAAGFFMAAAEDLLSSDKSSDLAQGLEAVQKARECLTLTGQVMASVKEAAERKDFDPSPVHLGAVVAEAMQLFEFGAEIVPLLDMAYNATWVLGNRVRLEQVITNLIRNAMEATEGQASRELRIIARRRGKKFVEIRVEDNGPGVSKQMEGLLFSAFSSTKAEGTGVGLSICKVIVEQHHGRIWTEELPDGTAFCFTVPRSKSLAN